jgi:hypothetical protein
MVARFAPFMVVAVLLLAGCGSKHAQGGALSACELRAENHAMVSRARDLFNAGRLGTADELAANRWFRRAERPAFLDSSGHLLPYEQLMATNVSWAVLGWVNTLTGSAGDEVYAAALHIRANSPCKNVTVDV